MWSRRHGDVVDQGLSCEAKGRAGAGIGAVPRLVGPSQSPETTPPVRISSAGADGRDALSQTAWRSG